MEPDTIERNVYRLAMALGKRLPDQSVLVFAQQLEDASLVEATMLSGIPPTQIPYLAPSAFRSEPKLVRLYHAIVECLLHAIEHPSDKDAKWWQQFAWTRGSGMQEVPEGTLRVGVSRHMSATQFLEHFKPLDEEGWLGLAEQHQLLEKYRLKAIDSTQELFPEGPLSKRPRVDENGAAEGSASSSSKTFSFGFPNAQRPEEVQEFLTVYGTRPADQAAVLQGVYQRSGYDCSALLPAAAPIFATMKSDVAVQILPFAGTSSGLAASSSSGMFGSGSASYTGYGASAASSGYGVAGSSSTVGSTGTGAFGSSSVAAPVSLGLNLGLTAPAAPVLPMRGRGGGRGGGRGFGRGRGGATAYGHYAPAVAAAAQLQQQQMQMQQMQVQHGAVDGGLGASSTSAHRLRLMVESQKSAFTASQLQAQTAKSAAGRGARGGRGGRGRGAAGGKGARGSRGRGRGGGFPGGPRRGDVAYIDDDDDEEEIGGGGDDDDEEDEDYNDEDEEEEEVELDAGAYGGGGGGGGGGASGDDEDGDYGGSAGSGTAAPAPAPASAPAPKPRRVVVDDDDEDDGGPMALADIAGPADNGGSGAAQAAAPPAQPDMAALFGSAMDEDD